MIQSGGNDSGQVTEAPLPRRDWLLLPVLSLLTICFILGSTHLIARLMFFSKADGNCMIDDRSTGLRGIPNCVFWDKSPETPLIDYRFNGCGHRAGMECGPKPQGVYRIAMAGSSIAFGSGVSRGQSFAALLPAELSARTGRKVELYNESVAISSPHPASWVINELLASQPDLVLWSLTPLDIVMWPLDFQGESSLLARARTHEQAAGKGASVPGQSAGLLAWAGSLLKGKAAKSSITDEALSEHPISSLTMHFLYESQSLYVKSYLTRGGLDAGADIAGSLRTELSSEWQGRLRAFDTYAADIEARMKAAGVPLAAVLLPMRAQAAMISIGEWPAGYDPYKLDDELRTIITGHGGTYLDILPSYRDIPNPEQDYFPVLAHPNANGHRILSGLLAKELTSGAVPALSLAAQQQSAKNQSR